MRYSAWVVAAVLLFVLWHGAGMPTKALETSDTIDVMQLQTQAAGNLPVTVVADFI